MMAFAMEVEIKGVSLGMLSFGGNDNGFAWFREESIMGKIMGKKKSNVWEMPRLPRRL